MEKLAEGGSDSPSRYPAPFKMKKDFKSDFVLLFELASGWKLEDYLYDRASRGWKWRNIAIEMNQMIRKVLLRKVLEHGLFKIKDCNLQRWYKRYNIKSMIKRKKLSIAPERLAILGERDQIIIKMRNGIGYEKPFTMKSIGMALGISKQRVGQLEERALKKLKGNENVKPKRV